MSELPPGWVWTVLGEIAEVVSGSTPRTNEPSYWDGDIPWITPDDLSKNKSKLVSRGARSITQAGYESCSTRLVPAGTVLYTSRAPIGYVAIASNPVCTNQGFKSFVPVGGVTSDYMYWFLQHATPAIRKLGSGTTFPELSKTRAREIPMSLPPLAEQKRIVAAIEEQLSRLDVADESLNRAHRKLAILRSQAVEAGFSGDWPWTTLGAVAEIVGGVTKDSKRQGDPRFVEVPYLRVANVQRGFLDLSDVASIRVPPEKAKALELQVGDVLFNEGGDRDKLGRGWIWSGEIEKCIHQNHVFRARLRGGFEPRFVSWHGNTFGQRWFEEHGRQTTNLASLNLTTLKSFPVPAPPLEEQRRVVTEIDRQLSLIDAMSVQIGHALRRSAAVKHAVLAHAFSGELVPQDPHDEPASVLLKRIAAERAAAETATGARPRRRATMKQTAGRRAR